MEVVVDVDIGGTGRAGGVRARVDELAKVTNGRSKPSIAKTGPHKPCLDIGLDIARLPFLIRLPSFQPLFNRPNHKNHPIAHRF